jgi:hypothetical protein
MKYYVFITDAEAFASGSDTSLNLEATDRMKDIWTLVGDIEVEVNVDREILVKKATENLDYEAAKHQVALGDINSRKQNLLALPHLPGDA